MTARNDIEALFRQIGGTSAHYREFAVPDFVAVEPIAQAPQMPAPAQVLQTLRVGTDAHSNPVVSSPPAVMTGLSDLFSRLALARPEPSPDGSGAA